MANSGRADFDQLFRSRSIPPGEPYFVLRAQDDVAAATVRSYVQLAKDAGAEPAFLELAAKQADAIAAWPKKKVPDVDLEDHERKQLAYAWTRREWRLGAFSAEALAEQRGFARGHASADFAAAPVRRPDDRDLQGDYVLAWWRGAATPDVVQFVDGEWQDERGVVFAEPDLVRDLPQVSVEEAVCDG